MIIMMIWLNNVLLFVTPIVPKKDDNISADESVTNDTVEDQCKDVAGKIDKYVFFLIFKKFWFSP